MTGVFLSRFEKKKRGVELNEKLAPHVGMEQPTPPSPIKRSTTFTNTAPPDGSPALGLTLGGQHYSTADYITGQWRQPTFPLAVTVLPGFRNPGHGSAHDARRAAPVDRVCESSPRRGRDLARVRVLNKPSGGVRPAQHTTAHVGYQRTSNFLWT